ncbi:MAG TPA: hypothetical protein VJ719_13840 [Chthoniobacterales bacterium]|nr:hypothetical protein [Chthoniobacterales bacterium]
MKKRFAPILKVCATVLVGISLCTGVASVSAQGSKPSPAPKEEKPSPTPKPPKPSPTPKPPKPPKPSPTPKPGKCIVCDRSKNKAKDKQVKCDEVDKFLAEHPGSTRGPCNATPVTNP